MQEFADYDKFLQAVTCILIIQVGSQRMARDIAIRNTSGGLKVETGMSYVSRSVRLIGAIPGARVLIHVAVTRTVTNHAGQYFPMLDSLELRGVQLVQRHPVC